MNFHKKCKLTDFNSLNFNLNLHICSAALKAQALASSPAAALHLLVPQQLILSHGCDSHSPMRRGANVFTAAPGWAPFPWQRRPRPGRVARGVPETSRLGAPPPNSSLTPVSLSPLVGSVYSPGGSHGCKTLTRRPNLGQYLAHKAKSGEIWHASIIHRGLVLLRMLCQIRKKPF